MQVSIYKIDTAMKVFFLIAGLTLWLGIWLTGFDIVHWIFYLPATFFIIASITGICPGMMISKQLFRN
jgi:hypothetical protein